MDAYPQPPRYPRPPPPPPTADHFHHHHHAPPAPPPQPPQQSPWYPNQFQNHPPPPQQNWAPPPPPPHGYSVQHHPPNHYPPPPPPQHWGPPPPQSYPPQPHQGWGNANWGHHQAQKNEEDWAAKVKAWVESKAAMDNQHPQSQFSGPPEEQNYYPDHHAQGDFHYSESQYQQFPASSYQQFPAPGAHSHVSPATHQVESAPINSGPPPFVADVRQPYTVANGTFPGDASYSVQDNSPMKSSSLYQQEVPSSYSSVAGNGEPACKNEPLYESQPLPAFSVQGEQHHVQQTLPSVPYGYGNYSSDLPANIADQPLTFSKKYNHDSDPNIHINYAHHNSLGPGGGAESVAAVPPVQSWAPPVAPDAVYSSIPPSQQHDPSVAMTSSIPGSVAPPFGGFPGASFQSSIPSASVPFALGSAPGIHASTTFPGDMYGNASAPERPKKPSVPNWLREEIIKKKAVISNSLEQPKEETQSIEDEDVDKSLGKSIRKGDQADSRSVDSPRSTEDDDDEDSIEAARTAAINQEIKRILTEVLSKVTDELFDEIATKVLSEDDLSIDVAHCTAISKDKSSPSLPSVTASRASAKVLIPERNRDPETGSISGKSSSSAPGNVLGLANYSSDEEDDEIQSSNLPDSREDSVNEPFSMRESDKHPAVFNGKYQDENKDDITCEAILDTDTQKSKTVNSRNSSKAVPKESNDENNVDDGKVSDLGYSFLPTKKERENAYEVSAERVGIKNEVDADTKCKDVRVKSDKDDRKMGRHSSGKNFVEEAESGKIQEGMKRDDNSRRGNERYDRKEKADDRNGFKEKDQIVKIEDKAKESDSRKRSNHPENTGDRRETEKERNDHSKKRERDKYKEEDRSRYRNSCDASQHKRRHSSSIESRGRSKKENSVSRVNASSEEISDDSRRKSRSRRHNSSPSPVRSRKRQVSRSPHSKHDQRRHSPYSSLDTSRGRKMRSKSPKRRHK